MTNYYRASELWFYNYFYFLLYFIYRFILIRNKAGIQLHCIWTTGKLGILYSTVWKGSYVTKSKADESMIKVKFPKTLILIIMLKIYTF